MLTRRVDNDYLFASNGNGTLKDNFGDERILGDDDSDLSNIDPYRGEVVKTTTGILGKNKSCEKEEFKSVEINGTTIEYLVLDEFYKHGEILEYARENKARLPSEDELRELIRFCGVEKFINNFPGHKYPDGKMIGGLGEFIQYWLESESTGGNIEAIMIINGDSPKILTTSIPKNCGIYACLIKK